LAWIGDTHGELAYIFSKAKDELKFHHLHAYNKEENTHNFQGAVRHFVAGHEHCSYVPTLLPNAIYEKLFKLEMKLSNVIWERYKMSLEDLTKKHGWTFENVAIFCEKEGI
jgi:hypothetical protein